MPTLAQIANGLRYGWSINWHLKIEGIPTIFCERVYNNAPPTNYYLDGSLAIEPSAKVGIIVDRTEKTGIGKGFDLTFRFNDTATVRSYFTAPTAITTLTADVTPATTTVSVESTSQFAASGNFYLSTQTVKYSGKTGTTFTGLTLDAFGPKRTHKAGLAIVTNKPDQWRGRRAWLYAVLVDPFGRTMYSANVLDNAPLGWSGLISEEPERLDGEWQLSARSLDRILADPLAGSVSGKGQFLFDDDPLTPFVRGDYYQIEVVQVTYLGADLVYTSWGRKTFIPFANVKDVKTGAPPILESDTGYAMLSTLRTAFASAVNSLVWSGLPAGAAIGAFSWERTSVDPVTRTRRWHPNLRVTGENTVNRQWIKVRTDSRFPSGPSSVVPSPNQTDSIRPGAFGVFEIWPYAANVPALFIMGAQLTVPQLKVILEDGDFDSVPSNGFVKAKPESGEEVIYEYAKKIDRNGDLFVVFDDGKGPSFDQVFAAIGEAVDLDLEFIFKTTGLFENVVRQVLMSTGAAINGAFDVLALSQGYGIAEVDTASFATVFDGFFDGLTLDLVAEGEASFADLFGALLTLSQTAIVTKGANLNLTAIKVSHPDSIPGTIVTIDKTTLAFQRGAGNPPIRARQRRPMPTLIVVDVEKGGKKVGSEIVRDVYQTRRSGAVKWNLKVPGVNRDVLGIAVQTWGKILFRAARVEQVIEVDVVPWLAVDIGDVVSVSLADPRLWQASTGTPGYVGLARVIGRQINLTTYVQTLFLLLDGSVIHKPLCPSAPVVDYVGTTGAPTSVFVPAIYYSAFSKWSVGTWKMLAYERSVDADGNYINSTTPVSNAIAESCAIIVSSITGTVDVGYYSTAPTPVTVSALDDFETLGAASPDGFKPNGTWKDLGTGTHPLGWQNRIAAPPSVNTGPQGASPNVDHTATGLGYYTYVETSSGSAGQTAHLGPGALDLSGYIGKVVIIDFWRYMYGATMGTAKLQVFTGGAWVDLWSLTGDQGMGWVNVSINISRFLSTATQLRFQYARGSSFTGDFALDDIKITAYEPKCYITIPNSANDNADQGNYLHNDDVTVWG